MKNILTFPTLTSSNDEAMLREYPSGTVIVAEHQTAGRGQRGNMWLTKAKENLTFSAVIHPTNVLVNEQYIVSMIAALAASDTLIDYGVDCRIKWSNDLYVNDSKIGGILIEHAFNSDFLAKSVIGIGLNINQTEFSADIPNPTSLKLLTGHTLVNSAVLETFIDYFDKRCAQNNSQLHKAYLSRLWRREGQWSFRDAEGQFTASIEGVDPKTGRLTLRDSQGQLRSYWFKEVEFVL